MDSLLVELLLLLEEKRRGQNLSQEGQVYSREEAANT